MIRRKVLSGAVLALGLAAAGSALAQTKTYKVGISLPEAQNPFYVLLGKSIVSTLEKRGLQATLLAANSDVNQQVNNINDLVASQVDALLISPLDTEGAATAVQRAHAANIPIFMVARTLDEKYGKLWKTFVGIHFDKVGDAKGRWLVANGKPGKVAMLLGPPGALVMVEQEKSFRAAVEPAGYKVVFAQNSGQTRENGLKLAEDALVANPDLVSIYASNDDLALGAAQAVKAAGLQGKVAVLGLNGTPPALAAVNKGEMAATVLLDPVGWGKAAADSVAEYLLNKTEPAPFVETEYQIVADKAAAYDLIPPPLRERLGVSR